MLETVFADIPYRHLEMGGLTFACSCSQERLERVVISLGRPEVERLLAEQDTLDMTCEFCRSTYHFGKNDLERILQGL
jgi:molecular chaperone Hsp33